MKIVPNKFPVISSNKRVALIGEAPGRDEEYAGQPFVGMSGRFLAALLSRAGISKDACFLGNISQHRPDNNDISRFSWTGMEIQYGLDKLREDIEKFNPNIVILLGNVPLKAAKDIYRAHPLKPNAFKFKGSQWRGSLFIAHEEASPFFGRKCMATYHPAYCLRDYDCTPLLQFDLRKAVAQADSPKLVLPQRELITPASLDAALSLLYQIRYEKKLVALDIEGGIDSMSCISFATSPNKAFIVPFTRNDGSAYWQRHEELQVWRALAAVLEDGMVPKVLQNSLYDRFVLHFSYGLRVQGVVDDTMLKHWELYSELEKSLGVQASLYTDEPYYKFERKSDDDRTFYEYCCKDSAVTHEINGKLDGMLRGCSLEHYRMNVAMLNPLLYMELRGIRYDEAGAAARRDNLLRQLYSAQARLNRMTGYGFKWTSKQQIFQTAKALMSYKKANPTTFRELANCSRKDAVADAITLAAAMEEADPSFATIGLVENLCDVSLNVDSSKQFIPYLYETLQLPTQYTEKRGEEPRPTADYEALLKLSRVLARDEWRPFGRRATPEEKNAASAIIQTAIEIRALGTRAQMLGIRADKDGRIRCGYNIVGSNTGRLACYESPTGSGYNLQTIPNYTNPTDAPGGVLGDRDLFLADVDHWFFQCDLAGADGWTVAAYSAMLGDRTLLDDYLYGLKPARNIAIMLRGYQVDWRDRASLKEAGKKVGKDDWDYFAAKRVQHGASYLEGGLTISRNVLKDSEGKFYMPPSECDKLKEFFFQRYWGIRKWHDWVARQLANRPILTAASGQVRQFFGRPDDILTKAVAFEPQANTTFANNLAMQKLWIDHENRTADNRLRIEPLHSVHDAICGQFRKEQTDWALPKIRAYYNNPLNIAGQSIVIPFEGGYGRSWGELNEGKI